MARGSSSAHLYRLGTGTVLFVTAALILGVGSATAVQSGGQGGGLTPPSWSDFDGDGFADLAIGAPGDSVDGRAGAGSVTVLYGTATGLTAAGSQLWTQNSTGILDSSEPNDGFGTALAAGDFNRDGYADLAVGVPREDIMFNGTLRTDAGTVHLIYGSAQGLTEAGDRFCCPPVAGAGNLAGSAVAALDCRGPTPNPPTDGFPELAIGNPGAEPGGGSVSIFFWDTVNFAKVSERDEFQDGAHLGASLAAGRFGGSTGDDLAMGEPDYDLTGANNAGRVLVWKQPCTIGGPDPFAINMSTGQVPGEPAGGDGFGFSLAAGPADIPGDDLIFIGVPFDDLRGPIGEGPRVNGGSVYRCNGLGGCVAWFEGFSGWPDAIESGDLFGWSIAVGELGRGTGGDVVVGVPGEAVAGHEGAGAVDVLYRDGTSQRWTENSNGIPNSAQAGENFGRALASVNWGSGAMMDVAIGVPDQVFGGLEDIGSVHVLYGSSNGLTASNDDYWHRSVSGVAGNEGVDDRFGAALR